MNYSFTPNDEYLVMTFFQMVFIAENLLKMVAYGLWGTKNSYFKNLWFIFDLGLIMISVLYSQIIQKPEIDLILFRSLIHIKFLKIPGFQTMLKGFDSSS